ncbi:MAG: OmpA family protein [Dermatophilaceae bacterium]
MRFVAVLAAAGLVVAAPVAVADPSPSPSPSVVAGVPVWGQTWMGNVNDDRLAVLSIHGLRRVEGATVLYYSMGLRKQDQQGGESAFFSAYGNGNNYVLSRNSGTSLVCTAAAIDMASSTAYSALTTDQAKSQCISTKLLDYKATEDDLGRAPVGWVLLAPVPAEVSVVDVLVGSQLVQGVPVEDGVLEPTVADEAPAVGMGWPEVELSGLSTVVDAEGAVFALRSQVKDVEKKVTTSKRGAGEELDLDASVLFATDQATLTPRAGAVIAEAAKRVSAAGGTGNVVVTGHTDGNATPAYNLDLSKRRAAAVAAALRPRVPAGVQIAASGKGEAEPIADNGTESGRALNRRVTITLPK